MSHILSLLQKARVAALILGLGLFVTAFPSGRCSRAIMPSANESLHNRENLLLRSVNSAYSGFCTFLPDLSLRLRWYFFFRRREIDEWWFSFRSRNSELWIYFARWRNSRLSNWSNYRENFLDDWKLNLEIFVLSRYIFSPETLLHVSCKFIALFAIRYFFYLA